MSQYWYVLEILYFYAVHEISDSIEKFPQIIALPFRLELCISLEHTTKHYYQYSTPVSHPPTPSLVVQYKQIIITLKSPIKTFKSHIALKFSEERTQTQFTHRQKETRTRIHLIHTLLLLSSSSSSYCVVLSSSFSYGHRTRWSRNAQSKTTARLVVAWWQIPPACVCVVVCNQKTVCNDGEESTLNTHTHTHNHYTNSHQQAPRVASKSSAAHQPVHHKRRCIRLYVI